MMWFWQAPAVQSNANPLSSQAGAGAAQPPPIQTQEAGIGNAQCVVFCPVFPVYNVVPWPPLLAAPADSNPATGRGPAPTSACPAPLSACPYSNQLSSATCTGPTPTSACSDSNQLPHACEPPPSPCVQRNPSRKAKSRHSNARHVPLPPGLIPDSSNVKTSKEPEMKACADYKNGRCQLGDMCPDFHKGPTPKDGEPDTRHQCRFYLQGLCKNDRNCGFAHRDPEADADAPCGYAGIATSSQEAHAGNGSTPLVDVIGSVVLFRYVYACFTILSICFTIICLLIDPFVCLSVFPSLSVCLSMYFFCVCFPVYPSMHPSIQPSIHLSIQLPVSIYQFVYRIYASKPI